MKNTDQKYKARVRSRVANLKDKKNPKLKERVIMGLIPPENLAVMSAEVRLVLNIGCQLFAYHWTFCWFIVKEIGGLLIDAIKVMIHITMQNLILVSDIILIAIFLQLMFL